MTVRLAMLFEEVDSTQIDALLADPAWVGEQKMDGTRALAVVTPTHSRFLARGGTTLGHTAATQHLKHIVPVLSKILVEDDYEMVLDGEIMIATGEYHLFDIPFLRIGDKHFVQPTDTFAKRREVLEALALTIPGARVSIVRQARTEAEKRALLAAVEKSGGEGIMLKRLDSAYQPGKRVRTTRKVKFVKTADVVVTGTSRSRNSAGRETGSFTLATYDGSGNLVEVGACSAIGKPPVEVGDVIEVAFLYWTGDSLYQPRMVRRRQDKRAVECRLTQFRPYSRATV